MIAETIPQLRKLSADEKIILATELWQEACAETGEPPNRALVDAINARVKYYEAHPDEVSPWEEVRARISRKP